ncbi:hypothetical protein, partial [Nocardioides salarius]|uniref:hypothetical protein n=1 Tax=Nocardioides salarius TaxID=374513 RepID=UPI0030FA604B
MPFRSDPTLPTPWPPPELPVDLEGAAQAFASSRPSDTKPTPGAYRRCVELLGHSPASITDAAPAKPGGWVDGVQRRALLARIEHRDLTLVSVIAGCVLNAQLRHREEMLAVVCSTLDHDTVTARAPGVPVMALPEITPWGLPLATDEWIHHTRSALERRTVELAPKTPGHVLGVDGSLPHLQSRGDLVGIVKEALDTDWIADPRLLPVREGWRSPAIRLPAGRTDERTKLSCYLRLHTAGPAQAWGHGLVRIEVYEDGEVDLDAAAAMVYAARGGPSYGDPRWLIQP